MWRCFLSERFFVSRAMVWVRRISCLEDRYFSLAKLGHWSFELFSEQAKSWTSENFDGNFRVANIPHHSTVIYRGLTFHAFGRGVLRSRYIGPEPEEGVHGGARGEGWYVGQWVVVVHIEMLSRKWQEQICANHPNLGFGSSYCGRHPKPCNSGKSWQDPNDRQIEYTINDKQ